jgi:hypothetical protein
MEMIPEWAVPFDLRDRAGNRTTETAVSNLQARQVHLDRVRKPAAGSLGRGSLGTDRTLAARG